MIVENWLASLGKVFNFCSWVFVSSDRAFFILDRDELATGSSGESSWRNFHPLDMGFGGIGTR